MPSWLHEHLGASEKSLVVLPRSDHLVSLDRERERVITLTRDFVCDRDSCGCRLRGDGLGSGVAGRERRLVQRGRA